MWTLRSPACSHPPDGETIEQRRGVSPDQVGSLSAKRSRPQWGLGLNPWHFVREDMRRSFNSAFADSILGGGRECKSFAIYETRRLEEPPLT